MTLRMRSHFFAYNNFGYCFTQRIMSRPIEMEELNLELAEIITKLESDRQQQRLKRVRYSLNNLSV